MYAFSSFVFFVWTPTKFLVDSLGTLVFSDSESRDSDVWDLLNTTRALVSCFPSCGCFFVSLMALMARVVLVFGGLLTLNRVSLWRCRFVFAPL